MKVIDLSGQTFGALKVLRKDIEATKENGRGTYWCKCSECNEEKLINSTIFRGRKPVVSCGCRKKAGYTNPKSYGPDKKWEKRLIRFYSPMYNIGHNIIIFVPALYPVKVGTVKMYDIREICRAFWSIYFGAHTLGRYLSFYVCQYGTCTKIV